MSGAFQRKAPDIQNAYQLLADRALLAVVQTALGIPAEASVTSIEKQAAEIEKRMDLEDLQSPEKLGEFLQRFTTLWELNQPAATSSVLPGIAGFGAQPGSVSIGVGTLMSIQSVRLKG